MGKTKIMVIAIISAVLVMVLGQALMAQDGKIDLNTATAEQLQTLKYVGQKYAQNIIEYRDAHGPFKTIEDILKVPGIGPKAFEANKDMIYVTNQPKQSNNK